MTPSNILAGLGIGGFTGGAMLATEVVVSGSSQVPVEAAVSVAVFACGSVWWLGRKFQSVDDRLKGMEDKLSDLRCIRDKKGKCDL